MDTAAYETNALVINNISFIEYALYEPASPPDQFGPGALELEGALRSDGYLAFVDHPRRALWCFRLLRKDIHQDASGIPQNIEKCGYNLTVTEAGSFEPAGLMKSRGYGPNAVNTPSSSSSSTSNPLDMAFRGPQSATLPGNAIDQDSKTLALADAKGPTRITVKEAHEYLISAVLSAISWGFCTKAGATPLNPRTLLLTQHVQSEGSLPVPILASSRVYLTTTGSLVVLVSLSPVEGLIALSDDTVLPPLGVTVVVAPLGVFATCQAITDGELSSNQSAFAQSPDTQVSRLRPDRDERTQSWRSIGAKLMQTRDLPSPISGTQKWLSLQRVRRRPTELEYDGKRTPMVNVPPSISWPSSLCFCKAFSKLSVRGGQIGAPPTAPETSYDPLSLAKSWFLGTGERDGLLLKKKRERDAAAAQEAIALDGQSQHTNGLSPLALHRPSNAGAPPGAMYPTPPDAIQNPVGATPSLDGTMPSPPHNASATAMVDIDTTMSMPADGFNENWDSSEIKRERTGGSFESENLFGDLGPDMFGDNDITDADFSFFDEQPDGMDLALDMADTPNADGLLDMSSNRHARAGPEIQAEVTELPASSIPPAPVFTKPELKHARSTLNEVPRKPADSNLDLQRSIATKRQASPFNPDTVFKRIRASLDNRKAFQQNSNLNASESCSIFDKVDFGPSLSMVNSKYQGNGRFDFSLDRSQEPKAFTFDAPPTTDYLERHGKGRRNVKNPPANIGELFARMANGQGSGSQHPSPTKMDDPPSDADDISLISDQDDSSYDSDEPTSPMKTGSTRRRRVDDDGESLATSFRELECLDAASPYLSVDLPRFSKSDIELPLTRYFADPEPPTFQVSLQDQDFIIAAQILTEQACTSTIGLSTESNLSLQSRLDTRRDLLAITNHAIQDLRSVLPTWFGDSGECQLRPFLEVQDVPLLGQPTRMQPRPPGTDQIKPQNPFQIQSPHFEMRRYESKLSVLPSAVAFWESLGLGPSNGSKNINSVCIYPDFEGISDDIHCFLDKLQSVYESLKLGSFSRMSASPDIPGGLLPYQMEKTSEAFHGTASALGSSLLDGLTKLSDVLAHLTVKEINLTIFFVYSSSTPGAIVESCYGFHQLFERYKKVLASSRKPAENDIVLQLVPIEFVASSNSLAMPSPVDFVKLALETYDRCTLFGGAMPAPAVVLEQTLPRILDFKLSATPSASLLHENTCLHIAYAQSIDERWITAAWTDNRGSQQMTASYCLGRKGKAVSTPLSEVAQEIWGTTHEIISVWKVHWRIIITKCGVMEQAEIDLWSSLAQAETKATVSLTLITVDTDPSLQLIPPAVKVPSNAPTVFYTTPVSTPQPSIVSPEQSGNPATPSLRETATSAPTPGGTDATQESDADATLADVTDQTWGAISSHRLNNSTSLTELNPAIISGYLVKRGGIRTEDPPVVMEVNIVHSEGNPRAYETLLREMLTYFRGLGTLARARGMVDKEVDVRPWHVAAAETGVRALYMFM
ncbi:mediator complex subunit 13 C-terminal-domain-containing protein [Xylariales sp. AK1849]|nr:mediator complex subunit 13 C-terminal-domain-containing protein [Xylariales sp. AK1849]